MSFLGRLLPVAVSVALVSPVLVACSGDDADKASGYEPTSLAEFDASSVRVDRSDFCDRFSEEAIAASVGTVTETRHYGNGESATLVDGVEDVSHEFNCTFVGADGRVARAWVFVPQVPPARAKSLVADAKKKRTGCTTNAGGGFGSPAVGSVCRTEDGSQATYAGLFVDAWLSCSLGVPDTKAPAPELRASAGEWCVEAAKAASTPAG